MFKLEENQVTRELLRKTYFKMALQYHPDKQKNINNEKFNELHESYENLMKYYGYMDDEKYDIELEEYNESFIVPDYVNKIHNFIQPIIENDFIQNLKNKLIFHIQNQCEEKIEQILQKLPIEKLKQLILLLETQNHLIPNDILEKIKKICFEKEYKTKIIRIYPTLNDLIIDNLYKLHENEVNYYVPMWHHELIYDNNGIDLCVQIIPKLDHNITIDEYNNIHINKKYSVQELWEKDFIEIQIGCKKINIPIDTIKLISKQTITIPNRGISIINNVQIYNTEKRGHIFIHLTLELYI